VFPVRGALHVFFFSTPAARYRGDEIEEGDPAKEGRLAQQ
jgi:hypothetical protein